MTAHRSKPQGAAYNALMEKETKESLAVMAIGLLGDINRSQAQLSARRWHESNCLNSGLNFDACLNPRCARARLGMAPPPSERLAGEDFHFEDSQVMAVIRASEYYKETIAHALHSLTSGEKWSLYRAVVALADAQRKMSEPSSSLIESVQNAGKIAIRDFLLKDALSLLNRVLMIDLRGSELEADVRSFLIRTGGIPND
jgi:hypothetical protein